MANLNFVDALEPRMLLSSAAKFAAPADPRTTVSLDPGWRFTKSNPSGASGKSFNDSKWLNVSLPHTWNNLDGQDGGNNYYRGTGWYRKHLTPSSSLKGKRIFIRFDGADIDTDFYLNGTWVGSHKGGYAAFVFDVTPYIKIGSDNVLAVKVNNAADPNVAPLSGGFDMDGGIYRDVSLIATNSAHVDLLDHASPGLYLTPSNISTASANVAVKTKLKNDGSSSSSLSIETDVVDAKGLLVTKTTSSKTLSSKTGSTLTQNLSVKSPHLWYGTIDPYLYTVYVIVKASGKVVDVMSQPLGLRTFKIDPNKGFILNGKPYDLHGVALHQDRLNEGFAVSDADQAQDVSLLQEIGATFVRLVHYQHDQTTYNLLDRAGIVAWTEIPLVNSVSTSSAFISNAKQQLVELIRQNYNHPSIVVWGLFNELFDGNKARTVIPQLDALAHSEDPTRLTTAASYVDVPDNSTLLTDTDVIGENRYYGWYYGQTSDMGTWADAFHAENPNIAMAISEYGAGGSVNQHEADPSNIVTTGTFHPEEYESLYHEQVWPQLAARPWIWAKSVWNMFDFAEDDRSEGDTPGRNDKGLVTYDRKTKKDAFYYYKAQWSSQKFVYITSRRWTQRTDALTDVKIYSNCDSVELFVNGVSQGVMTAANHVFVWAGVTLATGDNTIQAVPTSNPTVATDQVTWNLATPPAPPPDPAPGQLAVSDDSLPADSKPLHSSLWKDLTNGQEEV